MCLQFPFIRQIWVTLTSMSFQAQVIQKRFVFNRVYACVCVCGSVKIGMQTNLGESVEVSEKSMHVSWFLLFSISWRYSRQVNRKWEWELAKRANRNPILDMFDHLVEIIGTFENEPSAQFFEWTVIVCWSTSFQLSKKFNYMNTALSDSFQQF